MGGEELKKVHRIQILIRNSNKCNQRVVVVIQVLQEEWFGIDFIIYDNDLYAGDRRGKIKNRGGKREIEREEKILERERMFFIRIINNLGF